MKAIVKVGYKDYVLPVAEAVKIMEMLEGAEVYETKWHKSEEGRESYTTYHVYPDAKEQRVGSMETMSETLYAMCKATGKPQD